jgi:hypothetical protein
MVAPDVVHESLIEAARRVTVPVQFLLPWHDEHVDRQSALALFDAFASKEKTLHANPGDHRDVRWFEVDDSFLVRHHGASAGFATDSVYGRLPALASSATVATVRSISASVL